MSHNQSHPHDHDHDHGHGHDHPHRHPNQPDLEDLPPTYYQAMADAVAELLIEKNVFSGGELRETIEYMQGRNPDLGAKLTARAWTDPNFKKRLTTNAKEAAAEIGIDTGPAPLLVMENTPDVHNVIVCTLCSCYPVFLLGKSPDWYKSREYRSRMLREPRAVLAEFGTEIAPGREVRVHDSTADMRYMILPMRPEGTDGMTEEELAALVTRDSLIGVIEVAGPVAG